MALSAMNCEILIILALILVPGVFSLSRPEAIAGFVAYPTRIFSILFYPGVKLLLAPWL